MNNLFGRPSSVENMSLINPARNLFFSLSPLVLYSVDLFNCVAGAVSRTFPSHPPSRQPPRKSPRGRASEGFLLWYRRRMAQRSKGKSWKKPRKNDIGKFEIVHFVINFLVPAKLRPPDGG